jgi:DMSO/TMAO reductase YedYZ molybdopterin-dependent catalytic subunit
VARTVTRGFTPWNADRDPRLPPKQHNAGPVWPVLTAEPTPSLSTGEWALTVDGVIEKSVEWTCEPMMALPSETLRMTSIASCSGRSLE